MADATKRRGYIENAPRGFDWEAYLKAHKGTNRSAPQPGEDDYTPMQAPQIQPEPPAMPTPAPHSPASPYSPYNSQGGDPNPAFTQEIRTRVMGQILKNGSSGGIPLNDLENGAINLGGLAAPPGVGTGVGALKGLGEARRGVAPNTNTMGLIGRLLYGPSMGENAGNYAGHKMGLGPPNLPLSAGDPRATRQIQNAPWQNGQVGYPPQQLPIPDVRPRPKPLQMGTTPPPPVVRKPTDADILKRLKQQQDQMWNNVGPAGVTS